MSDSSLIPIDSSLDLVLDRVIDVPPDKVWAAWTTPSLLKQWFSPRPWTVSDCVIDPRPGGRFRTVMRSPEGQEHPNEGCFVDVVPGRRLAFTDALTAGYRPSGTTPFMTGVVTIEPHANGTHYVAAALHANAEVRGRHEAMGFAAGWAAALEQMIELIRRG